MVNKLNNTIESLENADDLKYIIRDTNTGMAYDIRSESSVLMLSEADQMLTKLPETEVKKPWGEWWNEKKNRGYQLLIAAEKGDIKEIENLIDEKKYGDLVADINMKGLDDFTPLHFAVSEGHIEIVEFLLDRKSVV